ncbi:MAG TPA: transposase [Oligoflexia bacterium]|nr:transposase [Oligoflexia bacterium]HMP49126.1 transposase [Oligoflexia bacterium]
MGKRYSKEVKEEVLAKIRGGKKVSAVAREHGINEMTVRNWLERDTEVGAAETLEMSRLRRENEALLRLVGQLTYESELHKKNKRSERR